MARRKKASPAKAVMDLVVVLPWQAGVLPSLHSVPSVLTDRLLPRLAVQALGGIVHDAA